LVLADLNRGVVPPLLRPVKAADKSLSTNEWRRFAARPAAQVVVLKEATIRGKQAREGVGISVYREDIFLVFDHLRIAYGRHPLRSPTSFGVNDGGCGVYLKQYPPPAAPSKD